MNAELIAQLKEQLIVALNLDDKKPEDIKDDDPIFGTGLGLDSIDALELIVLMEEVYGVKMPDAEKSKEVFASVATMAEYIEKNRAI